MYKSEGRSEDPGGFIFIQAYVKIRDGIQAIIIHSRNPTSVLNDMPKQLLPGQFHMWRIQTENNNPIRRAKKIELNQKWVRKYLQRKRATDIMDEENSLAQTALKRYFQSTK